MSTSEKKEPAPDAEPEETSLTGMVLGLASTTRTTSTSGDSFSESALKLLPVFGAAIFIQAVALHASLARAIWNGQFPDARKPPSQRITHSSYFYAYPCMHWRHLIGFYISALCALSADGILWWALRRAREAGERAEPLRAASAAEKGDAATTEPTAEKSHASTAESTAASNGHRHPLTFPRLTIALMLVFSFAGFHNLATAMHSRTIDTALTFFGPCFLAALLVASLMLHVTLSLPRVLHGSNSWYLVSAYRYGGLIFFPCTCTALGFASWYYKGLPLNPGVYAAGHWATALYVGVGKILEQSLLSS